MCIYMCISYIIVTRIVKTHIFMAKQEDAGSPWQGALQTAGPRRVLFFATAR